MTYAIKAPSRYVQGENEIKNIGLNTKKIGTKFFLIGTENNQKRYGEVVTESFRAQEHPVVFATFAGEATKDEVFGKMELCRQAACDAVVGMGGGKVIDTAKAVAENLGLPCVVIPTVASNDAPCSGVAVLYNDAGVVVKAVMTKRNPDLVLVDTAIIANAPARLFSAGIGDALATWFEARACKNSGAKTMARGNVSGTAYMMARFCYDTLLEHGVSALEAVREKKVTPELDQVIEATIYLSGIGFESGGLAAAHAVNDGLAQAPQCHEAYHGEKVAFGVLVQLVLEKASDKELEGVMGFMRSVELPMTLKQLGMETVDLDTVAKVAEAVCVPTQSTKNLSPDITAQDVVAAIIEADKRGNSFCAAHK